MVIYGQWYWRFSISNTNSCTADPVCWVQLPSALVYSTWEMSKGTFLLSSINIISNLDKMKATLRSLGASSMQHCWDSRQRCVWHLTFQQTDAKLWKQLNSFFLLCYKQYDGLFLFDAQRFGTESNLILLIWHCFVQVQVKRMIKKFKKKNTLSITNAGMIRCGISIVMSHPYAKVTFFHIVWADRRWVLGAIESLQS